MTAYWITCYIPSAVLRSHILVFGKNANLLRSLDVIPDEFTDLINNQVISIELSATLMGLLVYRKQYSRCIMSNE